MYIANANVSVARQYGAIQSPATTPQVLAGTVMGADADLKRLYITSTDPTPGTLNVKVRVNGVASTITATIASGALSAVDSAHTESVVAGDVIDYEVTAAGGATNTSVSCSLEVD